MASIFTLTIFVLVLAAAYGNPLEAFVGTWQETSNTNSDQFLVAIGVGETARGMAKGYRVRQVIKMDGPKGLHLNVEVGPMSAPFQIVFNRKIEEKTIDNRDVRIVHTMEGGHWISNEDWFVNKKKLKAKYDRHVIDGKMVIKITMGDLVATQEYTRSA